MTFGRDVLDHTKEKRTEVCLTGSQSTEHVLTMFIPSVFEGDNCIECVELQIVFKCLT